eukprot:TRINITY_DN1922_c0_g1_i2.p1 TRINITY_DN1922_c0_g1~~TRINITY_DN1922_c0_g1_i2.p1  ORF type:complete len:165 (+),score=38.18 TRINITY_DN1922_c0_g1_i2:61-495(+)
MSVAPEEKIYSISTTEVQNIIEDAKKAALKESMWCEEFKTHIPKVDSQHEMLFNLVATIKGLVKTSKSEKCVKMVLDELVDYTVVHFRDEEEIFVSEEYPGSESHIQTHKDFCEKMMEVVGEFNKKGVEIINDELLTFLLDWLK